MPTEDDEGLEAKVASHFGRSGYFTTIDTDTEEVQIHQNRGYHLGGGMNPALAAAANRPEVIVCARLGRKALSHFRGCGIDVYVGAKGTVRDAYGAFLSGRLPGASEDNSCEGRQRHQGR